MSSYTYVYGHEIIHTIYLWLSGDNAYLVYLSVFFVFDISRGLIKRASSDCGGFIFVVDASGNTDQDKQAAE